MRILITVLLMVLLASSNLVAQVPAVELSLTVSDGAGGVLELRLGLDPAATDTIDAVLGEAELPPPPPIGVFDARFIGNDISVNLGQGLLKDYRQGGVSTVGSRVHELLYQVGTGTSITIAWDFPPTVEGRLQDIITGSIIDTVMRGNSSYTVTNPGALAKLKMSATYTFTSPSAPVPLSPADGAVVEGSSVSTSWSKTEPGASRYWFEIATDSLFSATVVDSSITDTSHTVSSLTIGIRYWWKVRAYNAAGWGPFSEARTFTALQMPAQVVLLSPPNDTVVQEDNVQAVWHQSAPGVSVYWCEIATDSLFAFRVADSSVTDTAYMFSGLTNKSYWWRVRAKNALGWGPYSEAWKILVSITGVGEEVEIPGEFSLAQNYPNPFNPTTSIRYDLPEASFVQLKVYNALGEEVATLVNGEVAAGRHETVWDAANYPSGVYICRIHAEAHVSARKMILMK
ncbi:MAG: T9SS type A sorting domain-containing protein [Bacteroidota bacterium]